MLGYKTKTIKTPLPMSLLFEHPWRCHGLVPVSELSGTSPAIPTRCLATKDIFRGKNNENRRHFSRHNQHDVLTLLPLQGVLPNATVRSGGVFIVFATTMAAFGNQTGGVLAICAKACFQAQEGKNTT